MAIQFSSAGRQQVDIEHGVSSYGPEQTRAAARILRGLGTPFVIHQPK